MTSFSVQKVYIKEWIRYKIPKVKNEQMLQLQVDLYMKLISTKMWVWELVSDYTPHSEAYLHADCVFAMRCAINYAR